MHLNIRHIWIGWGKKLGFLPTSLAEQKLSELRLRQCNVCEHAKVSKMLQLLDGDAMMIEVKKCDLCTCPCVAKSLVAEEVCEAGKW